ncbi:MAG: DNA cytosine methyltransferase [Acidimicrobiia bacterium]
MKRRESAQMTEDAARLFDPAYHDRLFCDHELQPCSLKRVSGGQSWSVAGLFAGIGGVELGLQRAGMQSELLCEWWEPAQAVLKHHFADVPLVGDVRDIDKLPSVDLVAAGFPCTDLSQAGRTRGIRGEASGLVGEVFRLLDGHRAPWVLLENVRNMLVLDGGAAMRFLVQELEKRGYRWAYRLVDSRFTGVPQRRQRVILVATTEGDPREVLFADDAGEPQPSHYRDEVFGFYWTEGLRGLGWARDAVPTLKGGSTIGIPSPPAIWNPHGSHGRKIVTPRIDEAEQMQGFDPGWTSAADSVSNRKGTRWKLVGNAVTVGVSEWVGHRLVTPGNVDAELRLLADSAPWPLAACGANGKRWAADVSLWPLQRPYAHLGDIVDLGQAPALSVRGSAGFLDRATRGNLRFEDGFLDDIASHADFLAAA